MIQANPSTSSSKLNPVAASFEPAVKNEVAVVEGTFSFARTIYALADILLDDEEAAHNAVCDAIDMLIAGSKGKGMKASKWAR